jgi:hypothetical protein
MNDKMNTLAKRAHAIVKTEEEIGDIQYADYEEIFLQRFTGLVVLECANYLSASGEFNSSQNIKNLFGVE